MLTVILRNAIGCRNKIEKHLNKQTKKTKKNGKKREKIA